MRKALIQLNKEVLRQLNCRRLFTMRGPGAGELSAIVYLHRYAENSPIALTGCCDDAAKEIGKPRKLS
jgi:hypothetical protein